MCIREISTGLRNAIPVAAGIGLISKAADSFGTPGLITASIAIEAMRHLPSLHEKLHEPLRRIGINSERNLNLIANGLFGITAVRLFQDVPWLYLAVPVMFGQGTTAFLEAFHAVGG